MLCLSHFPKPHKSFLLMGLLSSLVFNLAAKENGDEFSRPALEEIMRRACDYQLHLQQTGTSTSASAATTVSVQLTTGPAKIDNGWIRSAFYTGVMALHEMTGDGKYLANALEWGKGANWTPDPRDQRHADNQCCGQTYTELFFLKNDPDMIQSLQQVFDSQMASPRPGRVDWWWCDSLFMAPPALARLAQATANPDYLRYMHEMFWDCTEFLYDKEEHLYYRDKGYFNSKSKNGKKVFWSRGNGWVLAGLARILQYLPELDPQRARYITLYKDMANKLATLQQADGLWRPSLLDPDDFATSETSGSGFFTYGMAWGVNQGILERAKFEPVVQRAWTGLCSAVTPEGRLGYVQQVAGAPGTVDPNGTQEYAVGAFLLAGSEIAKLQRDKKFDFGATQVETGYTPVGADVDYTPARGYGWVGDRSKLLPRDRGTPDALRRDFVMGRAPTNFRVDTEPGLYRLVVIMGENLHGDHELKIKTSGSKEDLPVIQAAAGEYATLSATVSVSAETSPSHLLVTLDSPVQNWIINSLSIEPITAAEATSISKETKLGAKDATERKKTWEDVRNWPDPIKPYVEKFRVNQAAAKLHKPTGLARADYLTLIAGNVDYWKQHQDGDGAIIDPYRNVEFQYSTPCYALAAATLVVHADRKDLLETAAKAMDWSCYSLKMRKGASAHEDFYPPQLAHALPLLKPLVDPARSAKWENNIRSFDPFKVYRLGPGGGNWNVVALSGEYLFNKLGLREDVSFIEESLAAQGRAFSSQWGLFLEGPMAYDHFPRLWAADMIAAGYDGKLAYEITEVIRRGALTSLFMQSPSGELPLGGRSAHHQWNEAEQCVTYEIYAAKAKRDGDMAMAGAFKRAAHLALGSMQRWQRQSGEMFIVKNRVDPSLNHGFEGYSGHSNYNLLPMAMLSIAWMHAEETEDVAEAPAPADVGGYVLQLEEKLHKIFANAGGMYVELDTNADLHYDATGFVRVHAKGMDPQLGPSETMIPKSNPRLPAGTTTTAAIGPAWKSAVDGKWNFLAEYGGKMIRRATVVGVEASPERVSFQVVYEGYFSGPPFISEKYVITPDKVEYGAELPGYSGPAQLRWPVFANNGEKKTTVEIADKKLSVTLDGSSTQTFSAPGAKSVTVSEEQYANRNGWSKVGTAEFPNGGTMKLVIEPIRTDQSAQTLEN